MTRHDAFEADLLSVFDADAQAPIPAGGLDRLQAAIANRQPRPERLAGLGGRWIGDPSAVTAPLGALRATVPILRLSAVVLLLLLTLALIGTAALVGARLLAPPPDPEKLLYELGGVIYLADADGSDPTRVGDGHLQQTIETGSVWSPDGRHFLYYQDDGTGQISDADGTLVSSAEGMGGYWSPDSTRLQAWISSEMGIAVYGIDGALQAELPLPDGYRRLYETTGVWAPDGQSVLVRTQQSGAKAMWQLPIDGSVPLRLADDHPFARGYGAFSPDGRQVAYVLQDLTQGASTDLVVANADGSDARTVATGNDVLSSFMAWSPDGKHLATYALRGARIDLVVLELATGIVLRAVPDFSRDGYPPFSWSSASDKLLFAAPGDGGDTSLWSVNVDGTGRTLLVQGATWGAMPPANATDSSDDPLGEGDDATPSPASAPSDAGVRPGASLLRIAGNEVSVVLPDGLAGRLPADGDAGNGISWGYNDEQAGRTGSRWTGWYLYAPGDIDDPSRNDDSFLSLPSDPVAWLRQRPGLTVLAERDIEVGGQPARLLDVVRPEEGGSFSYEIPVGDSGSTRAFVVAGGTHSRLVIWQLGHTWMVAQANAINLIALEAADEPDDLFMQFIADLRLP